MRKLGKKYQEDWSGPPLFTFTWSKDSRKLVLGDWYSRHIQIFYFRILYLKLKLIFYFYLFYFFCLKSSRVKGMLNFSASWHFWQTLIDFMRDLKKTWIFRKNNFCEIEIYSQKIRSQIIHSRILFWAFLIKIFFQLNSQALSLMEIK